MSLPPFHYARELRFQLKLSGPVNPWEVADRLQIKVSEEPLDADGYLLQQNNNTRILISKKIDYKPRKRFTIAHEIGHFYISHHQAGIFRCLPKDLQSFRTNKKVENEANEFAAEFLLPAVEVEKYLKHPPDFDLIKEISEVYGTSLAATAIKIIELTSEKAAVILSEAGEVKWFVKSKSFPYWIKKGRLHEWTYAYEYFVQGALSSGPQQLPAVAWCQGAPQDAAIMEDYVAVDRLGMVLSLLLLPFNETEDDLGDDFI
ncbi:ImmA/IrrE family metallo-endopeptidase [Moorella sp. Hama-1]|uniref:ImmA/IrrE family metallo-endopeptidase n=1 Tax=Moorella sp. Hama-1 TaxID=2138101 RepID=UPI000D65C650|nr:ImmA/IrrE family metallo-endopeptidase [Moorella sp. Hama-1]BCV20244.1 hypothetical protein hamaS1_03130 [Moorella sp. Hama-1]